ncbi:MAG: ribonuclease E/G [Henriciella sp.]|uniref:ribonuclease E/G n=1 Tax=Henriciella sp. TaxID=1968823 RepID=UPI003C7340B2
MRGISRIAIDEAPGETLAVAYDGEGRPVRMFIERWDGVAAISRLGDVVEGRLRKSSLLDGGCFFELVSGEPVFVRGTPDLTEGAEAKLVIMAEQRRGKLARAKLTEAELRAESPLDRWLNSASKGMEVPVERGFGLNDEAYDLALSPKVGLARGGLIEISRTSALIAIDVDSAGRLGKGSDGARAHAINREAVAEAARQLSLRNLGGLCVIDCVAPLNKESGAKLKQTFLETFRAISDRQMDALAPSRFGLLETKLAWGEAPIEDWIFDETGTPTGETELLSLFREVRREADADRSGFYSLVLSPKARAAYIGRKQQCEDLLQSHFSGRIFVSGETSERSKVTRQ